MKRRTIIRAGLLLLSLCVAAWMLPERIESVLETMGYLGHSGAERPDGGDSRTPRRRVAGKDSASILITPSGANLTPEQQARLAEQARRLAPMPYPERSARTDANQPIDPLAFLNGDEAPPEPPRK